MNVNDKGANSNGQRTKDYPTPPLHPIYPSSLLPGWTIRTKRVGWISLRSGGAGRRGVYRLTSIESELQKSVGEDGGSALCGA